MVGALTPGGGTVMLLLLMKMMKMMKTMKTMKMMKTTKMRHFKRALIPADSVLGGQWA